MKTHYYLGGLVYVLIGSVLYAQNTDKNAFQVQPFAKLFLLSKNKAISQEGKKIISGKDNNDIDKTMSETAVLYLPLKEIHYTHQNIYSQNLIFSDSSEFTYYTMLPNKGKLLQSIRYLNNGDINKYFYRYDNNGHLQAINYSYDAGGGQWYLTYRDTFIYNGNNLMKYEQQRYSNINNTFTTTSKIENMYDFSNKLIKQLVYGSYYNMNTNAIVLYLSSQASVLYNTAGQYTAVVTQQYDTITATFNNYQKEQYYYDNTGKITKIYDFMWNNYTNKWDTISKITNISWYKWIDNKIENLCNNLLSYADDLEYDYIDTTKYMYQRTYDPIDDALIDDFMFEWDKYSNNWLMYHWQYLITRNSYYGNMITEKVENYIEPGFNGYKTLNKWIYKQPSPTNVFIPDNHHPFQLFPNPNNGHFFITFSENIKQANIQITDISGKIIWSKTYDVENKSVNVHLPDVEKGVYFVSIQTDNINVFKMIIQ